MFIEEPPDDLWDHRFALDPPAAVRVLDAATGFVVAAGDALYVIDAGEHGIRKRDLPPGALVRAVAVEPWAPFRQAVASRGQVGVFAGPWPGEPILELRLSDPDDDATHLAWVRHDGESMLYLRQRSGRVSRIGMAGTSEVVTTPNAAAIAADADGVLALVTLLPPEEAGAWILPAGATAWDTRCLTTIPVGDEDDPAQDWRVYLTVRGSAVAFSMDEWSAAVSWEDDEDESKHFQSPPAVFYGPIAFQSERVIFAAYNVEGQVRVLRHERDGGVTRIARFGVGDDWEGTAATVTALAWDESRETLWAASPELGLIALTEPSASAKRYRMN